MWLFSGGLAVVFAGDILQRIKTGALKRVLLVGNGALYSRTSILQKDTIPGIGHAVVIEGGLGGLVGLG